ncbi:MAG: sugar phosphate isomerase/epimerase [Chlorobiaceae bacterium]|nr:sugar phosphate isomerase/epimerase [Chlorobiaceae bacterium]
MLCKQRFPFRFGTTSYIIPADILPNVEYLKDKVDDIELVLFESDEYSNLPPAEDIRKLASLAADAGLTYSVHLPLDVYFGNEDRKERDRSVRKCLRVIELCRTLPKSAYVMHFEDGPGIDINKFGSSDRFRFVNNIAASVTMLLRESGEESRMFCAENLNYPFELVWPMVEELGLSVTLDVGHLEFYGFPVESHLDRYLSSTRVLHMHGTLDGKDHNSLAHMNPETLGMVIRSLEQDPVGDKVFTMEIFSEDDFLSSCEVMGAWL